MTTPNGKLLRLATRAALAGATLLTLSTGVARAADAGRDERMPRTYAAVQQMKPAEVMHMMDAGQKGYVTHDEFMKFYEKLFERMDRDRNGKLSEPEFTDRG